MAVAMVIAVFNEAAKSSPTPAFPMLQCTHLNRYFLCAISFSLSLLNKAKKTSKDLFMENDKKAK